MKAWRYESEDRSKNRHFGQKLTPHLRTGLAAGFSVVALALLAACGGGGDGDDSPAVQESPVVQKAVSIDSGAISGQQLASNVTAFFGIPYAAPPVGDLRWKETQPVKAWTGTRETVKMGNACAQPQAAAANGDTISEDCLYMNVWVPPGLKKDAKAPVIVYVHGGAFKTGSASPLRFGGEQLAKKGAVYVSFNYRLGIFGNLALPALTSESPHKASGNYQLLDIIAALQWVQRNIGQFGGDPGNVTISGQSSGGMEMGFLNVSPLAKGLFHKIVSQSGWPGPWGAPTLATHEANGLKVMAAAGAASLAELRAKSIDELLAAVAKPEITALTPPVVEPTIDGYTIPELPQTIFEKGRQNDVPIIAGYTSGENFPSAITNAFSTVKTAAAYHTALQTVFGSYSQPVYDLYPAATDADVAAALAKLKTDASSARSAVFHVTSQLAMGKSPAYLYVFSRLQNGTAAPHGTDNQFWHGEILAPNSNGLVYTRNAWDTQLADAMMDTLIAFAKTGNPSTNAAPWPVYNPAAKKRINFGDTSIVADWEPGLEFFSTTWLNK